MSETPNADALLQLQDAAFVKAAYQAVLGRAPEPAGLASHLAQLRRGVPKERLLVAMASSAEARQAGHRLEGLDDVASRLQQPPSGLLQRMARRWRGPESGVAEGPLAVVENRLGDQVQQSQALMRQAAASVDRLAQHVTRIDERVQAIDEQLGRLRAEAASTLAQGEALKPRLQAIEGGLQALMQRADAAEARLVQLADVPRTLQEQHVGLLLALGSERAGSAPAAPAAPEGEPAFDPAAIVRVRAMLQATAEPAP